jgi:2-polyprenyl-6-methoxyphenol hydroxylase-like FAD-dependent oxidoreductase
MLPDGKSHRVLIVGGSLVGLSTALALAQTGARVTVLERSGAGMHEGGGGLGVDIALIRRVTGIDNEPPVCHGRDRDTTAWHLLREWLERSVDSSPLIHTYHHAKVTNVIDHGVQVEVQLSDGQRWYADAVLGADGVHSTVRRFVDPEHPDARYAGFVLWRVMVSEVELARVTALPERHEPSREFYADRYRLVTYPVPGSNGDDRRGHRRLNIVWYDPAREQLLRESGLLDGSVVRGSLAAIDLPQEIGMELRRVAEQTWPSPWAEALRLGFERQLAFGTPVAEYLPYRLVAGRIAIAGDAAHAASPMVGGGFRQGLNDAAQLATSFASHADVTTMLSSYESARLRRVRDHVEGSMRASRLYLDRGSTD